MNDSNMQSLIYSINELVEQQKVQNGLLTELVYWVSNQGQIVARDEYTTDVIMKNARRIGNKK